ncbi:FimV/HubP family polar landmark protein [Congregibacter brevis]|uniref:FimV/HubP family polar landmark protein n=1 Tax=Congregibacter brevis TaxID=3081201 RepID=A0ABZ0IBA2_9GAMM|nr:FimV/HubP family polar landmark protein [Congregibacter sp. IMCC45268]
MKKGGAMVTKSVVRAAVRAAVIAYGAAASLPALALGLGEIEMQSFLNEPLRAEVELLDTRQLTIDDIRIRLAGGDDFDRLGVERSYFLTSIKFDIQVDERSGRGVIKLSTEEAVLEPFIDLIIEARWPNGRLLREYTVLVDPPAFRQDVVTVSASERIQDDTNLEKPALAPESRPQASTSGASTSGDSVAVRESSLPAGEMPQRAFSAETADVPRSGNRYMVKRDETLWQIASEGKPGGISVQQAMLEIQRLNPEAFINGNINRIKAGYIIYLPAAGEVSSDDLARALDEVRDQNQAWREGQGAPGVTAAATLRVSADSAVDTVPQSSDMLAAADSGSSSAAQTASQKSSSTDATAAESADTAPAGESSGSAELAAQLDAMASRLDTLEQIVSLKDEQIATLEQALREAREAAAAAAAAPTPAPAPAPTVTNSTPAPTTATPQNQSGGIPWLPITGGLLVLAGAVVLFLRRRASDEKDESSSLRAQSKQEEDDVFEGVSLKTETFAAADPLDSPEEADTAPELNAALAVKAEVEDDASEERDSRGGSRGYGERKHDDYIDEGAAGDALAEADIYIAYGRYLQAIELLETAISSDPSNGAYRVKLIELYVDMGEEASAAEQLEELRKHGSPEAIERGEALVGGAPSAPTPAPSLDLDAIDEAPALDLTDGLELEPELEVDPVAEPDTLELSLEDAEAEDTVAAAAPEDEADLDSIEFEHLEIEEDGPLGAADDELDLVAADEELDLSDALVSMDDTSADSAAPVAEEADTEELLIADDADQMATKLDLARAYLDMGDSEGARGILEEVIEKGTEEQQQESRDLLTRIG